MGRAPGPRRFARISSPSSASSRTRHARWPEPSRPRATPPTRSPSRSAICSSPHTATRAPDRRISRPSRRKLREGRGEHVRPRATVSAPDEEDDPGDEEDGEDDSPEAGVIDAIEEQHAERGARGGGQGKGHGQTPHLTGQEAGPPVPGQNHDLVHEEKHLEIGLDGLPTPPLRGRIENNRWSGHSHRPARHARDKPGTDSPAPAPESFWVDAGPLEKDHHHEHPTDRSIE